VIILINIAIVEDDLDYQNKIRELIDKYSLNFDIRTKCFSNAKDFLEEKDNFDVLLLDIELPGINGIELADSIQFDDITIIYISSHNSFSESTYGFNIFKFILKSNLEVEFPIVLSKVLNGLLLMRNVGFITDQGKKSFKESEIVCMLFKDKKISLYDKSGKEYIILKQRTLKSVYEKLSEDFIQINKDIIINTNYIKTVKTHVVGLNYYEEELEFSRSNRKKVEEAFFKQVNKL